MKYLPILGKDDSLAIQLVRDSHVENTFFDKVHMPVRVSLRDLTRGKYSVLFPEGSMLGGPNGVLLRVFPFVVV